MGLFAVKKALVVRCAGDMRRWTRLSYTRIYKNTYIHTREHIHTARYIRMRIECWTFLHSHNTDNIHNARNTHKPTRAKRTFAPNVCLLATLIFMHVRRPKRHVTMCSIDIHTRIHIPIGVGVFWGAKCKIRGTNTVEHTEIEHFHYVCMRKLGKMFRNIIMWYLRIYVDNVHFWNNCLSLQFLCNIHIFYVI